MSKKTVKLPKKNYKIKSEVWIYPSEKASWHFVTLPKKEAQKIKKDFESKKRGWGSLPVFVKIGKTSWETSIFPDKRSESYLLPIKFSVRKKEEILAGDQITFSLLIKV